MAELISGVTTLADYTKRLDPNDKIAVIAEILNKKNAILDDIMWKEGNLITGEKTTIRTGIPAPTWRILNYGVPKAKSTTAQITDTCGMMETYCEVDKSLVELNGNTTAFLASENKAFIEGFGQTLATALFYGNQSTDPEKITGFDPRFNVLSTDEDKSGYNIIDAGSTTNYNTSIWAVVWGADTAYGIYPKGSKAGLTMENLGQQTSIDSNGLMHEVIRTHYKWDCGLTVKNWRGISRVANINWAAMQTAGDATDTSVNIIKFMQQAMDRVEEYIDGGNLVFYMHPELKSLLGLKLDEKGFAQLGRKDLEGRRNVLTFNGAPVRACRSILKATESRITA
jgi:hypothetical protein